MGKHYVKAMNYIKLQNTNHKSIKYECYEL